MYSSYYGFSKKPFSLLPDPEFLYMGKKHMLAFNMMEYGLMNDALISVITGEVGSGKTTLIRHLLNDVPYDTTFGVINNTQENMGQLLKWMLLAFGLEYKNMDEVEQYELFHSFLLQQQKRNIRTVMVVDEAQNLSVPMLEELRMLSNVNFDDKQLLKLLLVGQPELKESLHKPSLRQFAQRVSVDFHLGTLDEDETVEYIQHRTRVAGVDRQVFSDLACRIAYKATRGVPRLINTLCDTALVYGFAEKFNVIEGRLMWEVVRDKLESGILDLSVV